MKKLKTLTSIQILESLRVVRQALRQSPKCRGQSPFTYDTSCPRVGLTERLMCRYKAPRREKNEKLLFHRLGETQKLKIYQILASIKLDQKCHIVTFSIFFEDLDNTFFLYQKKPLNRKKIPDSKKIIIYLWGTKIILPHSFF